jgi:S1-C subfamily serine protease
MRFVVFAVLAWALAMAGQAVGQSWVQVTTDPARNSFDLDMGSITANGGFTQTWVRQTLARPQRDVISGKTYSQVVMQRMDDCRGKTFALTLYVYRNAKGEVLSNTPVPQADWKFVSPPPGSIAAGLQARICEVAAGRAALKPSVETGPATQTTWLPSAYDPATQTKYFIQKDAVVLLETGVVALIAKADLGTPRKLPDGSMAATGFLLQAFDCKAKTTVILSADSYDAAGNLVGVYAPPEEKIEPQAYPAGSTGAVMAKYACDPAHITQKAEVEGGTFVGTGWLGPKGYLITANHVVEGATKLELAYDGKVVGEAELVVADPTNDIAILKPKLPQAGRPFIAFEPASAKLGERVFTLGYPAPDMLGMALKMTSGEVSAMSGNDVASGRMDDARFLQVSMPIHSGNSGGPVIDSQGRAVGIVISKMFKTGDDEMAQNVNYALKIGYVRSLMAELPALGTPPAATPRPSLSALVAELQGSVFLVIATR